MAKLPKSFWGEAVNTIIYLINKSPSVPLDFDIPQRVWTGKDVPFSHFKVFGCKTFMYVPKEKRSKLDDKAIPCTSSDMEMRNLATSYKIHKSRR